MSMYKNGSIQMFGIELRNEHLNLRHASHQQQYCAHYHGETNEVLDLSLRSHSLGTSEATLTPSPNAAPLISPQQPSQQTHTKASAQSPPPPAIIPPNHLSYAQNEQEIPSSTIIGSLPGLSRHYFGSQLNYSPVSALAPVTSPVPPIPVSTDQKSSALRTIQGIGTCDSDVKIANTNDTFNQVKDASYFERRRKNNEAAKKSRDRRRAKEEHIEKLVQSRLEYLREAKWKLKELAAQNTILKTELAAAQAELIALTIRHRDM